MAASQQHKVDSTRAGLDFARRIEDTAAVVRTAKAHVKRAAPSAAAVRARKQLKKLRNVLESTQQAVIREGITERAAQQLASDLEALEALLEGFLEERPKKAALKTLADGVKKLRKQLKRA